MKVFIDHADLPVGKHVAKLLFALKQQAVASKAAGEDGGEGQEKNDWAQLELYTIPSASKPPFASSTCQQDSQLPPLKSPLDRPNFPGILPDYVKAIDPSEFTNQLKHFDVTILCCPQIANDPIVSVAVEYFTANKPSKQQTVILISSLLTWFKSALTDAESGLTEEDYRKRKSHPNYKWLLELERKVLKLTPPAQNEDDQSESSVNVTAGSYKAFVVSTGLVYHPYDGLFHEFLRQAWLGNDSDCFGTGDNVVPMIHLIDLASIAVRTVQILPETRYIVAVDDGKSPLSAVLKCVSENLGTGKLNFRKVEDGALDNRFSVFDLDLMQLNLRIDATSAKDLTEFVYETGAVDNIAKILNEYKLIRRLEPASIFIKGPPLSGKSVLAERLAKKYDITLIQPKRSCDEFLSKESTPSVDAVDDEYKERVREIKEQLAKDGKLSENQLKVVVKDALGRPKSRNQGYVLDGFPESLADATLIFGDDENKSALPSLIFDLEVSEDVLKDRISSSAGEEEFIKRYEAYRSLENSSDSNVLDFFDQREIHASSINCDKLSVDSVLAIICSKIGNRGYGPSKDQLESNFAKQQEESQLKVQKEKERQAQLQKEESESRVKEEEEWKRRILELKRQEKEILESKSAPLKQYLVDNVMPTLTAALVEVVKVRPADPIDYIAEYLFKHSDNQRI